jgi:hypothetical protein
MPAKKRQPTPRKKRTGGGFFATLLRLTALLKVMGVVILLLLAIAVNILVRWSRSSSESPSPTFAGRTSASFNPQSSSRSYSSMSSARSVSVTPIAALPQHPMTSPPLPTQQKPSIPAARISRSPQRSGH